MIRRPRLLAAGAAAAALVLLLVAAHRLATTRLHAAIVQALGPRASVGAVELGWAGVTLHELRVRSARGWPADDELRARRVHVTPDLGSLFSAGWRVRRIDVDDAYVSVLRTRDGRLRLLPALLERPPSTAAAAAPPALRIGEVRLAGAAVDFFDASVRTPAHRLRLRDGQAQLGPLQLPALDTPVELRLRAVFKGPQRDGRLAIDGRFTPATVDAELQARVSGVDLVALQPYLLRVNEGGVRRGTLDLRLDARVQRGRLTAPGTLTLTGLELADGNGVLGSFAGVPRQAVLAALRRDGRIEVRFTLDGRLDDPTFSLNESLAGRFTVGLAQTLGVSLSGVVEGVGTVIRGLFGR